MENYKVTLDKDKKIFFDSTTPDSINYFWLASHYLNDYAQLCIEHKGGVASLPQNYGEREPISVEQVALFMRSVVYLSRAQIQGEPEEPNVVEFLTKAADYIYRRV